jgi:hypothetical protein
MFIVGSALATSCGNVTSSGVGPQDGFYDVSYTHFVPDMPGGCPAAFDAKHPLVLRYNMQKGMLNLVGVLEPDNMHLISSLPFCNEGIADKWKYMQTEPGGFVVEHNGGAEKYVVNQIAVTFKEDNNHNFTVNSSSGYLNDQKQCLFFNKFSDHSADKPNAIKKASF